VAVFSGGLDQLDQSRIACPDLAAWASLADRRVPDWARTALVEHMAECDDCAALWEFMFDLQGSESDSSRSASTLARADGDSGDRPSGAIRLLLAAAGLATLLIYVVAPPAPIESGGTERWRGQTPHLDTELTWRAEAGPPVFEWQRWPEADSYRLRVWDFDGRLLIDQQLDASVDRQELVIDGARTVTVYWLIEAVQQGRVVASGDVGTFTLAPKRSTRPPDSR
jgi:hypothetical protein